MKNTRPNVSRRGLPARYDCLPLLQNPVFLLFYFSLLGPACVPLLEVPFSALFVFQLALLIFRIPVSPASPPHSDPSYCNPEYHRVLFAHCSRHPSLIASPFLLAPFCSVLGIPLVLAVSAAYRGRTRVSCILILPSTATSRFLRCLVCSYSYSDCLGCPIPHF